MVILEIPSALRQFTGTKSKVTLEAKTLGEAIELLVAQHPEIKARLLGPAGQLHRYIGAFIDGEDARFGRGLDTPLNEKSVISLLVAAAGG